MATRFCLNCGGEFIASVEECPDCEVPLTDERPEEEVLEVEPGTGQIEYQLHEWAVESRMMLEQLLAAAHIRHAWEGADLVVDAADENRVDAFVDQVDATTGPILDPDEPKVAYDVDDWTDEQQTILTHALQEVGIAYEFDVEGALVVLESDEDRVEALLDRIEAEGLDSIDDLAAVIDRDVAARAEQVRDRVTDDGDDDDAAASSDRDDDIDAGDDIDADADDDMDADDELDDDEVDDDEVDDDAYDGPEAMDVLSDLFVAADRLRHSATDAQGVLDMVARAEDAARMPLPYGFNRNVWEDIVGQVETIRDLLEDDESADEDIEEHAKTLRDTLRDYV